MKINKWMVYISVVMDIILLLTATILNFTLCDNYIASYVVNILLNIFAGSFILSITSLVSYFIYRRYLLRDIMNECLRYSNIFSRLEYFVPKKYSEEDINTIEVDDKEKFVAEYKQTLKDDNKKELEKILKEYIFISETSTRELWNMYDDLDFISDFSNNKKKEYWKLIFNYIDSTINEVREYAYHFKIYLSAKNGNYKVNEEKLLELQNKIFFNERFNRETDCNVKDIFSEIEVSYQTIHSSKSNEFTLVYNEVSNELVKMFDKVGKDNYFNKNYSGLGGDNNE